MLGISASTSISPSAAMRNNGSPNGEAVAPTLAVLAITLPANGARIGLLEVGAAVGFSGPPGAVPGGPPAPGRGPASPPVSIVGRENRAMIWLDVTASPFPTSTSVIRDPSGSRRTTPSMRGTKKPDTRTLAEKHSGFG